MVAAELHFANTMTVAREMFGKSYFSLGVGERQIVDQTILQTIAASYQILTPQFLASQVGQQPVGFRAHEQKAT
jgi:hypothetical protein